jgi:hypothetical protein
MSDYTKFLFILHYSYEYIDHLENSPPISPLKAISIEKFFWQTDRALFGWLGRAPADTESCISAYVGFLNSQLFFALFLNSAIPFWHFSCD